MVANRELYTEAPSTILISGSKGGTSGNTPVAQELMTLLCDRNSEAMTEDHTLILTRVDYRKSHP